MKQNNVAYTIHTEIPYMFLMYTLATNIEDHLISYW